MHSTTVLIRSIKSKARRNEARPSPSNPRTQNSLQKTSSQTDDAESERSAADADSTCTARRRRRRCRGGAGCGARASGGLGGATARGGSAGARRARVGLLSSSLEGLEALRCGRVNREHHALLAVTDGITTCQRGPRQARDEARAHPVCLQKNQSGADAFWIVKLKVGKLVAFAATGMKPESTPVLPFARVMIEHGSAKVDWVTVWFLATLLQIVPHQPPI